MSPNLNIKSIARLWSNDNKEKLLFALVKIFSSNMPLYVTYKHLFFNNKDCCDSDTISMLQLYCQMHQQHDNDIPVELLRNICNFIEANGINALKTCLSKATPDNLPITTAHLLFNIIFNVCPIDPTPPSPLITFKLKFIYFKKIRAWLNPNMIMHQITSMRSLVIKYMCQLSDKDLRLAGTKNTTELMYNTFKDVYDSTQFKIDLDGLSLAYKYFMSSTLTIRLCGIAQMNNQINTWSEFNSSSQNSIDDSNKSENELADWFCEYKIIEHLYGPNLHVEVIKRSQDILNFLAYTNRINDKHLDIIWQSAQLKHCSKPVLDMLITLHKHLYPEPLQYLTRLIFQMDLNLHNEQTLHLSACLTKFLWSTIIDIQNKPTKDTLVFQPLIQSQDHQILSSNDDQSDDDLCLPNKITKRHNQSMDTQPQSCDDNDDEEDDDDDDDDNSSNQPRAKSIPKKRRSNTRYIRSANDIDTEEEELYDTLNISKEDTKKPRKRNVSKEMNTEEDDEELVELHTKLQQKEVKTSTTEQSTNTSDEQSTSSSGSAIDDTIVLSQQNSSTDGISPNNNKKNVINTKTNRDLIKLLKLHDKRDEKLAAAAAQRKNLKRNHSSTQESEDGFQQSNDSTDVSKASPKNLDEFNVDDNDDGVTSSEYDEDDDNEEFDDDTEDNQQKKQLNTTPDLVNLRVRSHNSSLLSDSESKKKLFDINKVCEQGNTFLWDLVQEDKAHLINEKLLKEAEKQLYNLVCYQTDKFIKTKFVEGCLNNLSHNRSCIISLKLLPKILSSFATCRNSNATNEIFKAICLFDKIFQMTTIFFRNLKQISDNYILLKSESKPLPNMQHDIQVRLNFLTYLFSNIASPKEFELNMEQIETLWDSIIVFHDCQDDLFNWFLNQAKNKDQHAMNIETFKLIFMNKIPLLDPNSFSQVALHLYQELFKIYKFSYSNSDSFKQLEASAMDYIGKLAFKSANTEVSVSAIHFLNSHYVQSEHIAQKQEEEFINRCMFYLNEACLGIENDTEASLMVLQRGLLLLKNHLDLFMRRFSYQLRLWLIQGTGIISHFKALQDNTLTQVNLICHISTTNHKFSVKMNLNDYVGDLKATIVDIILTNLKTQASSSSSGDELQKILENQDDFSVRLTINGQEMTHVQEGRALSELQVKDNQSVLVSIQSKSIQLSPGSSFIINHHNSSTTSKIQCVKLTRETVPMLILSNEPHFSNLFHLLNVVSNVKDQRLELNARIILQKTWEVIMLLPTNKTLLERFLTPNLECLNDIVQIQDDSYKLLYYIQIIEILSKFYDDKNSSTVALAAITSTFGNVKNESLNWKQVFIDTGCLNAIYILFKSQMSKSNLVINNDAYLDCLLVLLKLIAVSLIESKTSENQTSRQELVETPRKKAKRNQRPQNDQMPSLTPLKENGTIAIDLLKNDIDPFIALIFALQTIVSNIDYQNKNFIKIEILFYSMQLLSSCLGAHNEFGEVFREKFCNANLKAQRILWLKSLILDCSDSIFRKEACTWIYRMCILIKSTTGQSSIDENLIQIKLSNILIVILNDLITLLNVAIKFNIVNYDLTCPKSLENKQQKTKGNSIFGVTCKDYFFLITTLIQNMSLDELTTNEETIDFDNLIHFVAVNLRERDYYENIMGPNQIENEILIGLLSLGISLMKHNPTFKLNNDLAKGFIKELYDYLFELPTPTKRNLPKCKSTNSRSLCYDLLIELVRDNYENYKCLHEILIQQHTYKTHVPYAWDYWPRDDVRSSCGYVGLTNLGATCYLATSLQHLFMIPEARNCLLKAKVSEDGKRFDGLLVELQKMFAFLLESERKSYSPKNFCKNYIMDNQQLNTTEQKDMTEFFTDLISKIEEMSPDLKALVKNLFGGKITNLVISLDCPHVSSVLEEFYTVRCQVAGMKDLYDSLNEITVKDTLEGDNMYTCSKCGKKVRAEKRACFRKLPKIICFNTMRYTFNMVTMLKEKVNTHFSFPVQLDMSGYMEKNLISPEKLSTQTGPSTSSVQPEEPQSEINEDTDDSYIYELIGVTVHTGTAEGGHYYSFIRDRVNKDEFDQDKWYLFNDAEVKQFDLSQLPSECFGGETTSKTYDSSNDRFMDLSYEKTHSAYMLFYEKVKPKIIENENEEVKMEVSEENPIASELINWIWEDNMHFIHDRNTFEHSYFNFIWQMCDYIPRSFFHTHTKEKQTLNNLNLLATKLGASFILETYIHAKEKPSMLQWIELLTKYFNGNKDACKWILEHMYEDLCWTGKVFLKCPNSTIRQMFQRLLLHVINRIKIFNTEEQDSNEIEEDKLCIKRFLGKLLELIELNAQTRFNIRYMSEFFMFLHEYARAGSEECKNLIENGAISKCIKFYLSQRVRAKENHVYNHDIPTTSKVISSGSDDETSDIIPIQDHKSKSKVFDKIINLISLLVEHCHEGFSQDDRLALIGEHEEMIFLYRAIFDDRNLHSIRNIIYTLVKLDSNLSSKVIDMIVGAIKKLHNENCAQFFNILGNASMGLLEYDSLENTKLEFTELIIHKLPILLENSSGYALQWLANLVTCKENVRQWMFENMKLWVKPYLIAHKQTNIRFNTAVLLANLIPNKAFREGYTSNRSMFMPFFKQTEVRSDEGSSLNIDFNNSECKTILHTIIECLFGYINDVASYTDKEPHSNNNRLVQYFTFLIYCMISNDEKILFKSYINDFWNMFFSSISNIHTVNNINKQAALHFFYHTLNGCQENIATLLSKQKIEKELPLVTVAVDHEDSELISYNRNCLHPYYASLRLCCQYSQEYARQMSTHTNFLWAFKHILPYFIHYPLAVQELNKCIEIFIDTVDVSNQVRNTKNFIECFLTIFMHDFDPKTCWQSILLVLKTFITDKSACTHIIMHKKAFSLLSISFLSICMMHQEATACNVFSDLIDCMHIMCVLLEIVSNLPSTELKQQINYWKEKNEVTKRLILLLNFYNNLEIRTNAIELLKLIVKVAPVDIIPALTHQLHNQYSIVNFITSSLLCQQYDDRKNIQQSIHLNFMGQYFPLSKQRQMQQPKSKVDQKIFDTIDDYNQYYHFYTATSFASSNLIRFTKPMFNIYLPISHITHTHVSDCVFIDDDDYKALLSDNFSPYLKFFTIFCELSIENNLVTKELVNLMLVISQHALVLGLNLIPLLTKTNEIKKFLLESPSLMGYLNSLIYDFRIQLDKQEVYEFIKFIFDNETIFNKFDLETLVDDCLKAIKDIDREYVLYYDELIENSDDQIVYKHSLFNFKILLCHVKLLDLVCLFKNEFKTKIKDNLESIELFQMYSQQEDELNEEMQVDDDKKNDDLKKNLLNLAKSSCSLLKNLFQTIPIIDQDL